MPLTMTLKDAGVTLLIDDSVTPSKIEKAMSRKKVLAVQTIGGKLCLVRGGDIVLVREITAEEIAENKKMAEEARERDKRFTPAQPKAFIPGTNHRM